MSSPKIISYFLNWMGPLNSEWIAENGTDWSAGRIDIAGTEDNPYGSEYSVPPMNSEDWYELQEFLDSYYSEEVVEFDELIRLFEKLSNTKIRWCNET